MVQTGASAEGLMLVEEVERVLSDLDEKDMRILRCAREEFARSGYHGTNVESIASAAGLGKGTVYRRFGNKLVLFIASIKSSQVELAKILEREGAGLPLKEEIAAKLSALAGHFVSHADSIRLSFHGQGKVLMELLSGDELLAFSNLITEEYHRLWRRVVEPWARERSVRSGASIDVPMLAVMLVGIIRGCYTELLFSRKADSVDKGVYERCNRFLMKTFFEGVFAQGQDEGEWSRS